MRLRFCDRSRGENRTHLLAVSRKSCYKTNMDSAKRFFDDQFLNLLESQAEAAGGSVRLLSQHLDGQPKTPDDYARVCEQVTSIGESISALLVRTIKSSLFGEDVQALTSALAEISESVAQFAERFGLLKDHPVQVDFAPQARVLAKTADLIPPLVRQLRTFAEIKKPKELNALMQKAEEESDALASASLGELCAGKDDPLKVVMLKDLYDQMQKIMDCCCRAGNLVVRMALRTA